MASWSVLSPKDAALKNLVVSDKLICKSEITTQKLIVTPFLHHKLRISMRQQTLSDQ